MTDRKLAIWWIDDDLTFKETLLRPERGLLTQMLRDYNLEFIGELKNCRIEHEDLDIDLVYNEQNITGLWNDYDYRLWLVDWNLENLNNGRFYGEDIVKIIRNGDPDGKIIFYSAEKTQEELRRMADGISNIECALRSTVIDTNVSKFLQATFLHR